VVVSNLWGSAPQYEGMLATYLAVFDQLHLVRVRGGRQRIVVAGATRRALDREALLDASRALGTRADLGFDLAELVARGYQVPVAPAASVLVDP
jgi:hypothetical protein